MMNNATNAKNNCPQTQEPGNPSQTTVLLFSQLKRAMNMTSTDDDSNLRNNVQWLTENARWLTRPISKGGLSCHCLECEASLVQHERHPMMSSTQLGHHSVMPSIQQERHSTRSSTQQEHPAMMMSAMQHEYYSVMSSIQQERHSMKMSSILQERHPMSSTQQERHPMMSSTQQERRSMMSSAQQEHHFDSLSAQNSARRSSSVVEADCRAPQSEQALTEAAKTVSRRQGTSCSFCKKNGETPEYYSTHSLRDPWGSVICPVLRKYRCPNCAATGDAAHTSSYCPLKSKK